jgi:uncharacterized protein (DUF4415 family)
VRFSPQNEEETSPEEETTVKMIDHSTTPDPLLELKEAHKEEDHEDIKCNSNVLRKIMIDVSLIGFFRVPGKRWLFSPISL